MENQSEKDLEKTARTPDKGVQNTCACLPVTIFIT